MVIWSKLPNMNYALFLLRIAEHPINRIDELLPWNGAPFLQEYSVSA